ncbi:hypothetical protein TWF696_009333 [Orbilia brochopaga]|uniref:GYF domain-containing protein n=1 Tax=Orbilia brochopaga TaxID=3140254 RepID=A0AAV9UH35_9PEZI
MSSAPPRPKATAASSRLASAAANAQFDLRNPTTLAAAAEDDEYDAETAAILEFDEISGQSRGVKRNAVNLAGYESDSSNDGFGGGKDENTDKRKKGKKDGAAAAASDDDDDMFGGGDDEAGDTTTNDKKPAKSKKDVRFLDIKEIEGQEDNNNTSDSSSSGDEDEEEAGQDGAADEEIADDELGPSGKKKHAPKIDKFNMKAEMEEGRFDDQGNFVRRAVDPDAVHDTWLEGVSKKDMKKARESQEKRDKEARQRRLEEDELITADLLADLILCLDRSETALEALARLNTAKKQKPQRPKKSWQQKKKDGSGGGMEVDSTSAKEPEDPKEVSRKAHIERITTAADRLLSRGFAEIYDEPRESLTRLYKREANEPWVEPADTANADEETPALPDEWEYKWSDGQGDGQIHGPYGGTEMRAWKEAGYFQEGVVFRRKGESDDD